MNIVQAIAALKHEGYEVKRAAGSYYISGQGEMIVTDSPRDVINAAKDISFAQRLITADAMESSILH